MKLARAIDRATFVLWFVPLTALLTVALYVAAHFVRVGCVAIAHRFPDSLWFIYYTVYEA